MRKTAECLTKIFHWVFFVLMGALFVCSLFVTATHERYDNGGVQEFAKTTLNNVPVTLLLFVIGVVSVIGFYRLSELWIKRKNVNTNVIAIIISALAFLIALAWIRITCIVPGADQDLCVKYANAINNGDYYSLEPGKYLNVYPHLLGLVAFLRVLFKFFGEGNYEAFRIFNAICIPFMIYSGYRIVGILSKKDKRIELFYLLSMLFCFPAYGYVLYVYGDLGGPAISMITVWMFIEYLNSHKVRYLIGFALSFVASVTIRKSMLIFGIAMLVVILLRMMNSFKKQEIVIMVVLIASMLFSSKWVNWLFPINVDTSNSLPPLACIVMGLNDDNEFAGWYNYYELNVFYDNGADKKATEEACIEVIKEVYLPLYINSPKTAVSFFFRKINSQWQSPMYQAIVSNNLLYGGQKDIVMSITFGKGGEILDYFMKVYQMLFYGCITLYLWNKRKEKMPIYVYTTMIGAFGGFLLSVVWEAKGRYILPYFLLLIPIYALASKELIKISFRKKEKQK